MSLQTKFVEDSGLRLFVQRYLKEEKTKDFWEKIGTVVLDPLSRGKGSGGWRYMRNELKNSRKKRKLSII